MKCWCRLCKTWVYEEHFLLPSGRREGCGQGRDDIRYHAERHLIGDVWQLRDGRYLLVDYVDSFCTGVTYSDGTSASCKYTATLSDMLRSNEAKLIQTFEEQSPSWADERGWNAPEALTGKVTLDDSRKYLAAVIATHKARAAA